MSLRDRSYFMARGDQIQMTLYKNFFAAHSSHHGKPSRPTLGFSIFFRCPLSSPHPSELPLKCGLPSCAKRLIPICNTRNASKPTSCEFLQLPPSIYIRNPSSFPRYLYKTLNMWRISNQAPGHTIYKGTFSWINALFWQTELPIPLRQQSLSSGIASRSREIRERSLFMGGGAGAKRGGA